MESRKASLRNALSSTDVGRRSSAESKMTTTCLTEMSRPRFSSTKIKIPKSDYLPPYTPYSLSCTFSSLLTLFPRSRYPSLQLSSSIGTNILCIAWSAFFGLATLRKGARRCFSHFFLIIFYVEDSIIMKSQNICLSPCILSPIRFLCLRLLRM